MPKIIRYCAACKLPLPQDVIPEHKPTCPLCARIENVMGTPKEIKSKDENMNANFILGFNKMMRKVHELAKEKGFWSSTNFGEKCALIHSEVSETVEAKRQGNPTSKKIPPFSHCEEELADTVIRIMDLAYANDFDLAGAIIAKNDYNKNREHKHGKEF